MDRGYLVENAVLFEIIKSLKILTPLGFWRDKAKNEVDFILDRKYPVEVKYTKFTPPFPRGLHSFITRYNPQKGVVLTKVGESEVRISGTEVEYFPAWKISRKLMKIKKN
jgi:predicted AAA+ superfamily ATPase